MPAWKLGSCGVLIEGDIPVDDIKEDSDVAKAHMKDVNSVLDVIVADIHRAFGADVRSGGGFEA